FLREQATLGSPQPDECRLPHTSTRSAPPAYGPAPDADGNGGNIPRTGKALFAWIQQKEEKLGPRLLRVISEWGQSEEFPERMVQWSGEQVGQAYAEACTVIRRTQEAACGAESATRKAEDGSPETSGGGADLAPRARPGSGSR